VRRGGVIAAAPAADERATSATTRTELGLPFYSGPVRYSQRVNLRPLADRSYFLQCPGITGNGAKVSVNRQDCGSLRWAPDEVEITAAIRPGENLIEIDWRGSPVTLTGRVDPTRLGGRVKVISRAE